MPFAAGGTVGVLGVVLLCSSFLLKREEGKKVVFVGSKLHPLVLILLILVAYSLFLNWLGYLISTFSLMFCLLFVGTEKERWWLVIGVALLATSVSYLVFNVWLRCNFPEGILKGMFGI
jgi:cell division protein FtsW (lipid II flippase)